MGMNLKRFFYNILMFGLLTLLVGCPSISNNVFDDTKSSDYYLSKAEASSGSIKTDWQLLAVRAFINENKFSQASNLLSKLPTSLNEKQQIDILLSQAEIAIKTGKPFSLDKLPIQSMINSQLYRYYTIKLALDGKNKDINAQIHDYVEIEKFVPERKKRQIINDTWNFLSKLSIDELETIAVYGNETVLQGWLDLIYAYNNNTQPSLIQDDETNSENINQYEPKNNNSLKQAINTWLMQYSNHPAKAISSILAGQKTLSIDDANAKNIALLLPLNGSSRVFGETIQQGYQDAIKFFPQEPQQNVKVFDTATTSLQTIIEQVQEGNYDLIVGPLLKDEVIKIKQLGPAISVLALNKIDNNSVSSNKMCFFALSPEDEAKDAAAHIFAQSKLKPLLLLPQNELGERVAQSFAKEWLQLSSNKSQAYVQYFGSTKTLSANMNRNVGIRLTGDPILIDGMTSYSLPSNRSGGDFDAVYIYASYDELTLIKPMLDMGARKSIGNTPSSIKLYSSSKSHVANASNDFYYDMNQTEYADIPMIINEQNNTFTPPSNIRKDYSLMRLYAMGIDAWRLANRYNQLDSHQVDFLEGMTGKLSTLDQCDIIRSLSWQQYTYGEDKSKPKSE